MRLLENFHQKQKRKQQQQQLQQQECSFFPFFSLSYFLCISISFWRVSIYMYGMLWIYETFARATEYPTHNHPPYNCVPMENAKVSDAWAYKILF